MIIYSTYKVDSFIHTKRPAHFLGRPFNIKNNIFF